ncbi:MAG: SdiA-regulated domain-containing protein [Flavobacterium sp.]|nr:SdiA-regulated domain-containing protein [Flavobacterium sp.]
MIFKKYIFIGITLFALSINAQKISKLKPSKSISVKIPEPSDICYDSKTDTFFIVSDTGILYETDKDCAILKKQKQQGTDFEAVASDGSFVYAVDESNRTIYKYDIKTFKLIKSIVIPYDGARNKGYEAFDFNKITNKYALLTESNPVLLFELDTDFKITNQTDLSSIASDISSARFYDGFLWLLSDEDMMLLKLNPLTYEVIKKWYLPVINPEGLAFDKEGNIVISCDDMQRVYYFNNPERK